MWQFFYLMRDPGRTKEVHVHLWFKLIKPIPNVLSCPDIGPKCSHPVPLDVCPICMPFPSATGSYSFVKMPQMFTF